MMKKLKSGWKRDVLQFGLSEASEDFDAKVILER